MRKTQASSRFRQRGNIHWSFIALGVGAVLLLAVLVGRAILTIITID
jgi:hypothetical protein